MLEFSSGALIITFVAEVPDFWENCSDVPFDFFIAFSFYEDLWGSAQVPKLSPLLLNLPGFWGNCSDVLFGIFIAFPFYEVLDW